MRGGGGQSNFGCEYVAFADALLSKVGVLTGIIVDCSHANANKDHTRQHIAFMDILEQIQQGNQRIAGIMLESFLKEGKQSLEKPEQLIYGLSITDSCIGWEETEELIRRMAHSI
jgi:3-deoxy-7-phosphoheptulonate synthase